MKKSSKVISIFMAAVFALSVFAVSASAVATELTAGNTKETATKIPSFGTEYVSSLSKAGEIDWFKFTTLSEDAYYTIVLTNYNISELSTSSSDIYSLNLYIYDMYNKEIAHLLRKTNYANIKLEKNTTYYVKVAMGSYMTESTGIYEVCVNYKLDPVPDNKDKATSVNINSTYKYSLDGKGDADWFKFTTFENDANYTISLENYNISELSTSSSDIYSLNLYIYDMYNKEIAHLYRKTNCVNVELEKNTTYYVKVAMGSNMPEAMGDYGFLIKCDAAVEPDESTKPENPGDNTNGTGFDFMAILTTIWNFFVGFFNFIIGLFA